jgi:hypothetical protein
MFPGATMGLLFSKYGLMLGAVLGVRAGHKWAWREMKGAAYKRFFPTPASVRRIGNTQFGIAALGPPGKEVPYLVERDMETGHVKAERFEGAEEEEVKSDDSDSSPDSIVDFG